jgi:hypothetical protein
MSCAGGAIIALWLAAAPDAPREWLLLPERAAVPEPVRERSWHELPPVWREPKLVVDGGWPGKVVPVAAVRLWAFAYPFDVLGVSAALTETHPLETEAGLAMTWHGVSLFARGGVSVEVLERRRASGAGWTMRIPFLAGARQVLERKPDRALSGYTATTGLNVIFWVAEDAGLDFEALAGADIWVAQQGDPTPAFSPDVRVSVGLAF